MVEFCFLPIGVFNLCASLSNGSHFDVRDPLDLVLICTRAEENQGYRLVSSHFVEICQGLFEHILQRALIII